MKRALTVVAILLIAASAYSQQQVLRTALVKERGLTPADFPQLKKILDNVYVFSDLHTGGLGYMTNDMIVITTDGVLVADGQGNATVTQKLVEQIKKLTDQPIKYVIVCSDHGDHTGGNAAFPWTATFVSSGGMRSLAGDRLELMSEQTWWETIKVQGGQLLDAAKKLIEEGNVRRVVVKQGEHTIAEFPLSVGVVGAVLAPVLAAIGAIAALATDCTILVERVGKKPS